MGILNTTPDSFSDGGRFVTEDRIKRQIDGMVTAGADLIDVGGESTRPFAEPVALEEELKRTIPAIDIIRQRHDIPVSIDTTKSQVARAALAAGADLINDISAFTFDPAMAGVARASRCPVIIMHMRGAPRTMQVNPVYEDLLAEIRAFLEQRLAWAEQQGLDRRQIILDPGIGFGKTVAHNLSLLKHLPEFATLGRPLLIGHSRKAFIGKTLDLPEPENRDMATAVISGLCAMQGAAILRVHDVQKTVQAVRMAEAILAAP